MADHSGLESVIDHVADDQTLINSSRQIHSRDFNCVMKFYQMNAIDNQTNLILVEFTKPWSKVPVKDSSFLVLHTVGKKKFTW